MTNLAGASNPSQIGEPRTLRDVPAPDKSTASRASGRRLIRGGSFELRVVGALAGGVVAGLALLSVVERATRVLGWTVAAAVGAALAAAIIGRLERAVGHRLAVVITALGVLSGASLVTWRVAGEIRRETSKLQEIVPRTIAQWEGSTGVGQALRDFGLRAKVERVLTNLPGQIAGGTPAQVARSAGSRGAAFVAGLVLMCFLCAGGRRSFASVVAWLPERRGRMLNRHAVGQLIERAHRRASDLIFFSAVKAVVIGLVVGGSLSLLSVPGGSAFGVLFAFASIVPGAGSAAALVGTGVLAAVTDGTGLWVGLGVVALTFIGDRLIHSRRVHQGLLDLGPVVGTVAVVGGFEVGGIGSALCFLALAAFGVALWSEYVKLLGRWEPPLNDVESLDAVDESSAQPAGRAIVWFVGAAGVTIATRLTISAARSVHGTAVLVLISFVLALALERLVGPIARRFRGNRRVAVAFVAVAALLVLFAAGLLLVPALVDKARSFGRELPQLAQRFDDVPVIGGRLRDAKVGPKVQEWMRDLPADLGRNTSRIGRAIGGAVDMLLATVVVLLLSLSMVVDGPRLFRSCRSVLPPRRRRTFDQSGVLVVDIVGRYFAGSLLVALLAGVMSASVGLALGVVLAPLAALWIVMTNLIPQVGGFLGGVVFVALGFATSATVGLACLVYFLTYQQFENHVIQPAVIGRAVSMSPAATMVVALVGGAVLGVPGAMIAVPVVGAVKVVAGRFAPNAPTTVVQ